MWLFSGSSGCPLTPPRQETAACLLEPAVQTARLRFCDSARCSPVWGEPLGSAGVSAGRVLVACTTVADPLCFPWTETGDG